LDDDDADGVMVAEVGVGVWSSSSSSSTASVGNTLPNMVPSPRSAFRFSSVLGSSIISSFEALFGIELSSTDVFNDLSSSSSSSPFPCPCPLLLLSSSLMLMLVLALTCLLSVETVLLDRLSLSSCSC
jgi:hypothetical protein